MIVLFSVVLRKGTWTIVVFEEKKQSHLLFMSRRTKVDTVDSRTARLSFTTGMFKDTVGLLSSNLTTNYCR